EPVELDVEHRAEQFRGPRADPGEGPGFIAASLPVEMAGVYVTARTLGDLGVAGRDAAALAAAHVLEIIEAERPGMADRAELPAFIGAAYALADILQHEDPALPRDL